MTKVSWRSWAVGLGCSLLAASAFAQNPTIEMKAVKLNPTCAGGSRNGLDCVLAPDCPGGACATDAAHGDISPVDTLNVSPGDIIVVDVLARDYSPANQRLLAYQFDVANSFDSSVRGRVSLLQAPRRCATKSDCSFISVSAECVSGVCASVPSIDPRAGGVNIDFSRFDFAFFLGSFLPLLDLSRPVEIRIAMALLQAGDSVVYPGSPRYLGTVSFQVGSDMCGTTEIRLDPLPDTVLTKKDGRFILPLDLPPLTLIGPSAQACKCLNIVDSDPPSCVIEARQPFNPDGSGAVNINSMRLKLDCPDATSVTSSPESFSVRELRPGGFGNLVNSVVVDPTDKRWVTVTFRRNLKAERWTCTSFSAGGGEVCLGLLAADVNSDSLVDEMDIEDLAATRPPGGPLTSCLRDTGSCTLRQCDADRSQRCTPADILRVVDIINGGGDFATLGADMGIVTLGGDPIPCPSLP